MVTLTTACLWVNVLAAVFVPSLQAGWNYDGSDGLLGPSEWKTGYPTCAETAQSPIDIPATSASQTTAQLTFKSYNTTSNQQFTLLNNGHSIELTTNVETISLVNSRLNGTYVLEQLHFHWGASDSAGSEHSIGGKFHPLEIHFVHYNSDKYASVSDAASNNDSSAVLVMGIFAQVAGSGQTPSTALSNLIKHLGSVAYEGNTTSVASFPLEGLLPCQQSKVYTYSGSLTTPGCSQVVDWNVFDKPIYVTSAELGSFRQVHGENSTVFNTFNFRPTQQLNDRTVYVYEVPSPCTLNNNLPSNGARLQQLLTGRSFALVVFSTILMCISTIL